MLGGIFYLPKIVTSKSIVSVPKLFIPSHLYDPSNSGRTSKAFNVNFVTFDCNMILRATKFDCNSSVVKFCPFFCQKTSDTGFDSIKQSNEKVPFSIVVIEVLWLYACGGTEKILKFE